MWKEAWSIVYRNKIKSLRQEMGLADFHMCSTKKLEVHYNIHMDGQGHKMVTLENVEVCCNAWYIVCVVYQRPTFIGFDIILLKENVFVSMGASAHRNLKRLHVKLLQYYQPLFFLLLMRCRKRQEHILHMRSFFKWCYPHAQNGRTYWLTLMLLAKK